jgi:hypothetical protein
VLGFIVLKGVPPICVAVLGDRAEAGERHVVGVDEEVLVSRAVQQPMAGARGRTAS